MQNSIPQSTPEVEEKIERQKGRKEETEEKQAYQIGAEVCSACHHHIESSII